MNIIGENLKKYRLLNNMSLMDAGKLLKISPTAIAKYEKGDIVPNSTKIIEFADAYNVKCIDILKEYKKPKMNFNSFRKNKTLEGERLELLKNVILEEVSKYIEVLELSNIKYTNDFIPKYNCYDITDADLGANKFRKYMNISLTFPIYNLIDILENIGVYIIEIKNINNKFDGFKGLSEIVENIPFIIVLDDLADSNILRSTLLHELGHLVLKNKNETINEEKLCDRFSRALLMPKEAIMKEFGTKRKNISMFELTKFIREYKVSYLDLIIRLKELNVISDYYYKTINNELKNVKNIDLFEKEKSIEYKKLVYRLESNNIISTSKACELLGVTADDFDKENSNYRY